MASMNLNLLAVIVAAAVAFALGAVWYSPALFARAWTRSHGFTVEQLDAMKKNAPRAYAVSFVCFLLMALGIAGIATRLPVVRVQGGVRLGFLIWIAFAVPLGLMSTVYSGRRMASFLIDAGYQLVYLLAMGAIIFAWR
jgi:hypothetical protein